MTDPGDWSFPEKFRAHESQVQFDLSRAIRSVVQVRSVIPDEAFTAEVLGTERTGNGVVIQVGEQTLVLTIAYLITEAESIWLTTHDGQQIAGHTLAFDQVTGFGLIAPLGQLHAPALELGAAQPLHADDNLIVIGHGGPAHALNCKLIAKREFAGYWEYLLEEALIVAPPHPQWGGAALLDQQGLLVGIGSLLLQEEVSDDSFDANLFVPIDLLKPILADLLSTGRPRRAARPWLGIYLANTDREVVIAGVAPGGPAHEAHLKRGDVITQIAGHVVQELPDFYRRLWAHGAAGVTVELGIRRGNRSRTVQLASGNRDDFLYRPRAH